MHGLVIAILVIVSVMLILQFAWFGVWVDYAVTVINYQANKEPRYITIDDNDALREEKAKNG